MAVGLGVLVASKRHPNMNERTYKGQDLHHQLSGPRLMQKRINEAERFGRWARVAPAFPAGEGTYLAADNELIDHCTYTPWDTWNGGTYWQDGQPERPGHHGPEHAASGSGLRRAAPRLSVPRPIPTAQLGSQPKDACRRKTAGLNHARS